MLVMQGLCNHHVMCSVMYVTSSSRHMSNKAREGEVGAAALFFPLLSFPLDHIPPLENDTESSSNDRTTRTLDAISL